MDVIHTDNEGKAAGDAPVTSSFEKQESFASDSAMTETMNEGALEEKSPAEKQQIEMQEELPTEIEAANVGSKNAYDEDVSTKEEEKHHEIEVESELKGKKTSELEVERQEETQPSDSIEETQPTVEAAPEPSKDVELESEVQSEESMETTEQEEAKETEEEKPSTPAPAAEEEVPRTPRTRGRKPNATARTSEPPKTAPTTGRRGRKRKVVEEEEAATPAKAPKTPKTPGRGRVAHAKVKLSYTDFVSLEVGDRVLSCGEGEQLGHPGRTTTKKPRKVDIIEDEGLEIVQVVAGGVHSALLTADGEVYMCGINEQGTVPAIGVEPEGSTDKFTKVELSDEIRSQGKIVMLAAGASFTAGLTDKGSVIAWGNLRDTSGEINVHPLLAKMKDHPVVLIHYKKRVIVKIAAGENHLVMLEEDGKVLTFGDGKMGQLGRSKRTGSIRPQYMVDEDGRSLVLILQDKKRKDIVIKDIHAGGYWTILVSDDQVFSFGLNNFDHLGVPVEGEAPADATTEDKRELRILTPGVATAYLGRHWTHIDGVQHIIARDTEGEVFGIGKNTDNALGLGTWTGNNDSEHWKYSTLERVKFPQEAGKIAGTTAKLGCSLAWTEDGHAYAWGCDTSGQLGLGLKDDDEKVVPTPQKITSAHLEGFKIMSASISDNHCLFLAKKVLEPERIPRSGRVQ